MIAVVVADHFPPNSASSRAYKPWLPSWNKKKIPANWAFLIEPGNYVYDMCDHLRNAVARAHKKTVPTSHFGSIFSTVPPTVFQFEIFLAARMVIIPLWVIQFLATIQSGSVSADSWLGKFAYWRLLCIIRGIPQHYICISAQKKKNSYSKLVCSWKWFSTQICNELFQLKVIKKNLHTDNWTENRHANIQLWLRLN